MVLKLRSGRRSESPSFGSGTAELPTSPSVLAPVVTPNEQTPKTAANGATAGASKPGKAKPPGLAIGLSAGGGALALGGIGCLAGAWVTTQQEGNADLTVANGTALADRGRSLNGAGIALTVTGGAMALGGAVTWLVLGRRSAAP